MAPIVQACRRITFSGPGKWTDGEETPESQDKIVALIPPDDDAFAVFEMKKSVLIQHSDFFRKWYTRKNPDAFFLDVSVKVLGAILSYFNQNGDVYIDVSIYDEFMVVARKWKIKGISEDEEDRILTARRSKC